MSLASLIGVAVGTAALVLVLSVFNGFESLILSLYNSFDPPLKVTVGRQKHMALTTRYCVIERQEIHTTLCFFKDFTLGRG